MKNLVKIVLDDGYSLKSGTKPLQPHSLMQARRRVDASPNYSNILGKMPRKDIDQNDPIELANSKSIEEFIEDYLPPRYVSSVAPKTSQDSGPIHHKLPRQTVKYLSKTQLPDAMISAHNGQLGSIQKPNPNTNSPLFHHPHLPSLISMPVSTSLWKPALKTIKTPPLVGIPSLNGKK